MTRTDRLMAEKNLDLLFEFEKYVLGHPGTTGRVPVGAIVVMQVEGDKHIRSNELAQNLGSRNGQTERLKASRSARKEREGPAMARTVEPEITLVQGKDRLDPLPLGHEDQSGVSEVHGQIAILGHEPSDARDICLGELEQGHRASRHHLPKSLLRVMRKTEQIDRFRDDRPNCEDRGRKRPEGLNASLVVAISSVAKCHERSGIDECALA